MSAGTRHAAGRAICSTLHVSGTTCRRPALIRGFMRPSTSGALVASSLPWAFAGADSLSLAPMKRIIYPSDGFVATPRYFGTAGMAREIPRNIIDQESTCLAKTGMMASKPLGYGERNETSMYKKTLRCGGERYNRA